MTDNEIRIAIAEKCGWTVEHSSKCSDFATVESQIWHLRQNGQTKSCFSWNNFKGKIGNPVLSNCIGELPDYPTDLNAIHEAWAILDLDDKFQFANELCKVVKRDYLRFNGADVFEELSPSWQYDAIANATARQRAEAFLRTFGLWKEQKDSQ